MVQSVAKSVKLAPANEVLCHYDVNSVDAGTEKNGMIYSRIDRREILPPSSLSCFIARRENKQRVLPSSTTAAPAAKRRLLSCI